MPNILVVGFYHHQNLGDDLFAHAFRHLFPSFNFNFVDHIAPRHLNNIDAIFFGGGSFLDAAPQIKAPLSEIQKHPLFYIGVGSETEIHPTHRSLIPLARLVAIRTNANYDKMVSLNLNTLVIPDLVYALPQRYTPLPQKSNSLLVIPNINTVPHWQDPYYKHAAWEYCKNEMAQALDHLLTQNYAIDFFPMSSNARQNDAYVAAEIINRMSIRDARILQPETDFNKTLSLLSSYGAILTQRYHGAILSNIANVPSITIHHHDKLKAAPGRHLSFYGLTKSQLLQEIEETITKGNVHLPIDRNIFESLKAKVAGALR